MAAAKTAAATPTKEPRKRRRPGGTRPSAPVGATRSIAYPSDAPQPTKTAKSQASEPRGQKVGVRLIAGVIARRIVPFVQQGDEVARGDRISLIQFGSRADVYLPHGARIKVKVDDHVVGGETVLALFE